MKLSLRFPIGLSRPFSPPIWRPLAGALILMLAALFVGHARAELPADLTNAPQVATLNVPASKHWVWVNDFVFPHMSDGMAYLIDGDSGRYLGTLSTGYSFARVLLSRDGKIIYSPETYFSRGTRGKRTDVVTLYDSGTLGVIAEIPIPPKRASNMPMIANAALTDDDRFLLVYNFNPAQTISVIDTTTRKFVREVESAGCALVYPTGPRTFFSVCGDGSLLLVELDDHGASRQHRTQPLLNAPGDPVTEKPVRIGGTWYFVSFEGRVFPLEADANHATVGSTWWMTSDAERKAGWRPGGLQQLAAIPSQSLMYAIMHRGPIATHKDPGKDVWVFDVSSRQKVKQIALKNLAGSIQISSDSTPLLYSIFIESTDLDIYDALSGKLLRSVDHVGTTPTIMVTP
ncbi:MAG TPA: amine dehydrogenase large subunit [Steroidobacteraceae bacterium]|nr:amine dehydrogenase large subunit [Steroidobacteraceae bacterium]